MYRSYIISQNPAVEAARKERYMPKKSLPSERIAMEIREMLDDGLKTISRFMIQNSALAIQRVLELEAEGFTGRKWCERSLGRPVYRNGYEPLSVATGEGAMEVYLPQFRNASEDFESKLLPVLKNRTDTVELLAMQMWVSGMSQADIAKVFKEHLGVPNMSESVIRTLCQEFSQQYDAFTKRKLSEYDVLYLFLDGIYLPLRKGCRTKEAVFVAVGITRAGRKVLLGLASGLRESYEAWKLFLSDLRERGLTDPLLAIRDSNPGLIRALSEYFPDSAQQVCLAHKMQNLVAKMPESLMDELRHRTNEALYAKDYATALKLAKQLIKDYQGKAEAFIKCFSKNINEMLAYLKFPEEHWRSIRTTNVIERRFGEVRRRTKVIPRFQNEQSALMLCHAVLVEDLKKNRWYGLKTTKEGKELLVRLTKGLLLEKKELKMVA